MFEKIKVRWAIGQALFAAENSGVIESDKRSAMNQVASHLFNASFGAELLSSGAAVNRHAAAAAVFARLASAAISTPAGVASADEWVDAGVAAMINAGAPRGDARRIVLGLIDVDQKSRDELIR